MKQHRKILFATALLLFVLVSCKEEAINLTPEAPAWQAQTRASIEGLNANSMRVLSSTESSLVLELEVSNYAKNAVSIEGKDYFSIMARDAHSMLQKGNPDLPEYAYSVVIPQTSACNVRVVNAEYEDITLPVAPSKGGLISSAESDPYTFSEVYAKDAFYPANVASTDAPFLMRDVRGSVVRLHPFQYNPVTGTLRVYTKMQVEVSFSGTDDRNVLTSGIRHTIDESMEELFRNQFINYDVMMPSYAKGVLSEIIGEVKGAKVPPPSETMLIICCDSFATYMSSFMTHKTSLGITTRLVTMSQVGTDEEDVAYYIREDYKANNNLTYVLLVGDIERVPTIMVDDENNPSHDGGSDTSYALVDGTDSVPDIYVGRFSARDSSEVMTMVNRTIYYENMSVQTWQHRSVGISDDATIVNGYHAPKTPYEYIDSIMGILSCSNYGTGVNVTIHSSDYSGYTAINSAISSAINQGAFVVNYIGRGHIKYWYPGYFTTGSVGNLTNDNKLPFVYNAAPDVGCFTQSYYSTPPCLAEAFLTAKNSSTGVATGAIGVYASSLSAPYYELITAQLSFNSALATYSSATRNFGKLCYDSAIYMRNQFGSAANYILLTMNYFGDPSLKVIPNVYVAN